MATFSWTAGTGFWGAANNWDPASGPPGTPGNAGDVAILPTTSAFYAVVVDYGTAFTVDQLDIGGATWWGRPALQIHGTLDIDTLNYTGAFADRIMVGNGGTLDINSSITDANNTQETIRISSRGGVVRLGSTAVDNSNVTYTFDHFLSGNLNHGAIEFVGGFTPGDVIDQHITRIGLGDSIVFDGADFTGDTASITGNTLTITTPSGSTVLTMNNVGFTPGFPSSFELSGNTITANCYARGTMIQTPAGEVPVEGLRAGRAVTTLEGGQQVPRIVRWVGHRRIAVRAHPHPETVAPIRIVTGAFAERTPHRDLLVSPDHAIYVDGKLICARQLVNGTTICQETGWTAVDYYHVELDRHAILLAEGLPAESYIDTGNGLFGNSRAALALHPDMTDMDAYPTRQVGSCAAFVWDEANVRPVWHRLADRAAVLGRPVPQRSVTTDDGLHLLAAGRRIRPVHRNAERAIFVLPRAVRDVRLVSRAQPPTEAQPWLEDRRTLGVRVARMVVRGADDAREIPVDHPDLATGWWAVERDGRHLRRWTNGEAVLPLPRMKGDALLEVYFGGTMTFALPQAA